MIRCRIFFRLIKFNGKGNLFAVKGSVYYDMYYCHNFFDISLAVELLICGKKSFLMRQNKNYSCICKSIIITNPTGFNIALTNVNARLKQRCINVASTLCNVDNPTSDFVSFSTSDQHYFNVDLQR